jgi:hypothetical protein
MNPYRLLQRSSAVILLTVFFTVPFAPAQQQTQRSAKFPYPEKLSYRVEWRLITAGSVTVDLAKQASDKWETDLHLESAGWVSRLFKVADNYKAFSDAKFCGSSTYMDAEEGKRHNITRLTFDTAQHKVDYDERDLVKNSTDKKQMDVPPCTFEITGALASLRSMELPPGKWATLPITNGKRMAEGKIEAQAKETLEIGGKSYSTVRYEAFLFDDVLYKRRGRLLIWMTDDADRLPVQFRLLMGFPIGSITVQLDKQQKM